MTETRNIVILGASFSGLSAAHYIARHTLPKLKQSKNAKHVIHLVDPSTHFWWHIAAPRSIVSVKEMSHEKCFIPIMDGFKQYPALKDSMVFHHGQAINLDKDARAVTIRTHEGDTETLGYYALVIATGIRSETPLTTLQGDHNISKRALDQMNEKLKTAKQVVIGGGGPVGVETAGELGTHLGGKAKITLIAGSKKLLPVLRQSLSDKAQKMLEKNGVKVVYNTKVAGTEQASDGQTIVKLDNGDSITTDVYISAVGMTPNTEYLPSSWKNSNGYVSTNAKTLRIDNAGPRVYAVGDVAAVDKGGVLNLYNSMPVWGANFNHDLFSDAQVGTFSERSYTRKDGETQLVPVGAKGGVGAFNGWQMPSFAVSMIKGKDYMLGEINGITQGTKMAKA